MSAGTTTNTMLDITSGLVVGEIFDFFLVSYGNDNNAVLPSDHSNILKHTFCKCVILFDYLMICDL